MKCSTTFDPLQCNFVLAYDLKLPVCSLYILLSILCHFKQDKINQKMFVHLRITGTIFPQGSSAFIQRLAQLINALLYFISMEDFSTVFPECSFN